MLRPFMVLMTADGGQTSFDTVGMLWVIVKHVKREQIESFYRVSPGKFVMVLKQPNLKEYYNHEINFKGKVGDHDHTFEILPKPSPKSVLDFTDLMKMGYF